MSSITAEQLGSAAHGIATGGPQTIEGFVGNALDNAKISPLHKRVVALRHQYVDGVALLDERAGGDFTAVPPLR